MSGQRAGRRVGLRLALVLSALGGLIGAGVGWLVTREASRWERERLEALRETRASAVRVELDAAGEALTERLAAFEAMLRADAGSRRRLLEGGSAAVDLAGSWAELVSPDLLTVLDAAGRVVSSAHWPEQAGLEEPRLALLVPDQPEPLSLVGPTGSRLVVAARRDVDLDGRRFSLVGGRALDRRWLSRIAHAGPAWVVDFDGAAAVPLLGPGSGEALDRFATDVARSSEPASAEGRWELSRVPLAGRAGELGAVVVGVDRRPGRERLQRLGAGFALLALVLAAAGAAAGAWTARRVARPVGQLVRAVDAIAAGRADYTFDRAARDEFEELESAFSRLQRSLEIQRRTAAAAERVAAWREVARHVAHEVKNPLVPIRLTIENLQRAHRERPELFDQLFDEGAGTILEEVEQLRRLVGEFSEFARLPAPERRRVELEPLVDGVLELYVAEPGLQIVRHYPERPTWVEIDSDQISRALKNVIGNAVEAMRETNGAVPPRLEVRTGVEGQTTVLCVRDNGPGLPPGTRDRIFQPNFTTKPEGTGLGMAITYRIVTEHGGLISVAPAGPRGTAVEIRLPAAAGREASES